MLKKIYLDHAATTPLDPQVLKAMLPYLKEKYGNPSSLYQKGIESKEAVNEARKKVAKVLGGHKEEIIFTGSGTESDNLALRGTTRAYKKKGNHIITSQIEHHAVLNTAKALEKEGYEVTYLKVDKEGLVSLEDLEKAIKKETILVSIMYANNEIGTIEPIAEIGKMTKEKGIIFHTDACQAAGALPLDVHRLKVDLLTLNGSKIYGPKGTGVLYIRRGVKIDPIITGGSQERNLRAGTENVAGIVGLAKALEIAETKRKIESKRLIKLRDYLIKGILTKIPRVILNGSQDKRLPNNINVSILDVEGESLILYLDKYGIQTSTGSACTSVNLEPSHVLLALGLPYEYAHGSLRLTLGKNTAKKDLDYVLKVLPQIVKKLREISPVKLELEPGKSKHPQVKKSKSLMKIDN